jgi:uncharacterized protein YdbL (DUF1318 family)
MHLSRSSLLGLAGIALLTACVTVNIYFPAAAAEKAADRIIKDVWGEQPGKGGPPAPESEPSEDRPQERSRAPRLPRIVWMRAAHAQPDLDISSPAIGQVRASMKARHAHLEPYYNSGAVGLTQDGLVAIRDLQAIPLPSRNQVKQWVSDENRDRNALYREIAQANGHPEWESEIRAAFARRWIANAAPGWWYQGEQGGWTRK